VRNHLASDSTITLNSTNNLWNVMSCLDIRLYVYYYYLCILYNIIKIKSFHCYNYYIINISLTRNDELSSMRWPIQMVVSRFWQAGCDTNSMFSASTAIFRTVVLSKLGSSRTRSNVVFRGSDA